MGVSVVHLLLLHLLNRVLFHYLCFHPDISKNVPKLVLFLSYQGVWGLQHTFKSALQPLVFKHFIGIICCFIDDIDKSSLNESFDSCLQFSFHMYNLTQTEACRSWKMGPLNRSELILTKSGARSSFPSHDMACMCVSLELATAVLPPHKIWMTKDRLNFLTKLLAKNCLHPFGGNN